LPPFEAPSRLLSAEGHTLQALPFPRDDPRMLR